MVPERFDPEADTLAQLQFTGEHPDDEHPIEMNRLHTLLHPRCFSRLTRSLGLDVPDRRLRVPRFTRALAEGLHSLPPRDRFRPPILSDRDRRTLTPTVSFSEFGK